MKQIRTRIREKRGSDYTEAELQQLASVKLEQFADPSGLKSDLLEQFRKRGDEPSTYHRHRGPRRWLLMLLHPILKRVQKQVMSDLTLYFEIIHNLVVEVTRLGIEVQNLKMKVESLSSRVDFDERRGRALEGVVQYKTNDANGANAENDADDETGKSDGFGGTGGSDRFRGSDGSCRSDRSGGSGRFAGKFGGLGRFGGSGGVGPARGAGRTGRRASGIGAAWRRTTRRW